MHAEGELRAVEARSAGGPRRLAGAALAGTLALALLVGAAAHAQLPSGETGATEVGHDSESWTLLAGAKFGKQETIDGSLTPFDADLYDVSMRAHDLLEDGKSERGFVAGAECREEQAEAEAVEGCERVPVIYRLDVDEDGFPSLGKAYRSELPGYAGKVVWIDRERALAVGGTGAYPRREPACAVGSESCPDPAGQGRAWLYDPARHGDEDWHELAVPEAMRGLTALGLDTREGGQGSGFAGALAQLWRYEDGRFTKLYAQDTEEETVVRTSVGPQGGLESSERAQPFRFRVRDIGVRSSTNPSETVAAVAVTAGCCASEEAENLPQILYFDAASDKWYVNSRRPELPVREKDWGKEELGVGEGLLTTPAVSVVDSGTANDRRLRRQSFFSLEGVRNAAMLASPDGPAPAAGEAEEEGRPWLCRWDAPQSGNPNPPFLDRPWCQGRDTRIRVISADSGWEVGEVKASGQGLAFSRVPIPPEPGYYDFVDIDSSQVGTGGGVTDLVRGVLDQFDDVKYRHRCPSDAGLPNAFSLLQIDLETPQEQLKRSQGLTRCEPGKSAYDPEWPFHRLPSYRLFAIDADPETDGAWAVGARGAVLRLPPPSEEATALSGTAGEGAAASGRGERTPLPSREPYDTFRSPLSEEPGSLPALAGRPLDKLAEPRLEPGGYASDPFKGGDPFESFKGQIVMSRDGSEGWALDDVTNNYHYSGGTWSRCVPGTGGGQHPPACAGLTEPITAAARVPLENDRDLSNDDEFEVVAINYNPTLSKDSRAFRYREGHWSLDADATAALVDANVLFSPLKAHGVAFTAPNHGWIIGHTPGTNKFLHYNGQGWINCEQEPAACGDPSYPSGRLPQHQSSINGMVAAGDRVYLFGFRGPTATTRSPMIIHHERGGSWEADPGGDPLFGQAAAETGVVKSLAVAQRPDGTYEGWALGFFGSVAAISGVTESGRERETLLRLERSPGGDHRWRAFRDTGALEDAFSVRGDGISNNSIDTNYRTQLILPGTEEAPTQAFIAQRKAGRIFRFNARRGRWDLLPAQRPSGFTIYDGFANQGFTDGEVRALAPDGRGGFWVALANTVSPALGVSSGIYFFHYTDRPKRAVFEETPSPFTHDPDARLKAFAGSPDGSVWAAASPNVLARYDRLTGWDTVRIRGWDPGRLVVRPSEASALALGPDGRGLAVGERGRIARIDPGGAEIDPASRAVTDRDLGAVAIAPDGSALIGGDRGTLLWRSGGSGMLRAIEPPPLAPGVPIHAVSLPAPDRAFLAAGGRILTGYLGLNPARPSTWIWRLEAEGVGVRSIAVDREGHGYAVGGDGLILERSGESEHPWRALNTGIEENLHSVALGPGGKGALIGGRNGFLATPTDEGFEVARHSDWPNFTSTILGASPDVTGVALVPGPKPGQLEAWAGLAGARGKVSQVLHYASDPDDPLLNPDRRARPLPDSPAPRAGELSFAAFGKSECRWDASGGSCPALENATTSNEVLTQRTVEEIAERARRPGGPRFALFSGDAIDTAGVPGGSGARTANLELSGQAATHPIANRDRYKHRRWSEQVADRLEDRGVPLFAAVGSQDLSEPAGYSCFYVSICASRQYVKSGDNLSWRQAMAGRAWEQSNSKTSNDTLTFKRVPDRRRAQRLDDVKVKDPDGDGPLEPTEVAAGGAATHYAVDVCARGDCERGALARIVVADSSLRSLAASDPGQNPLEPEGGQSAWLEQVLCTEGEISASGARCTRKPGQQAIIVSNTPTYSYGPGAVTDTATDATAFEALLMKHRAGVVVSGRLGWNGRYWATAPGVHEPCPGEAYRDEPPDSGARACGRGAPDLPADPSGYAPPPAPPATSALSDALRGAAPPAPPAVDEAQGTAQSLSGLLPFVVAAAAGGEYHPEGKADGSASEGFWPGYTVVRLDPAGDPRGVIVEQRPVFDWIALRAQEHVLRPGQRLTLRGVAREPVGVHAQYQQQEIRFDAIDSPAITHRYDLVEADERRPHLPKTTCEGTPNGYCPLPPDVATVDSQTGRVRVGRGNHPRAYAIGLLSVGDKAATWPLVFEPRRSFRPKPAEVVRPLPGPIVASAGGASISTPPQPPSPNPQSPQLNLPAPPPIPGLPTPTANPPAPPTPPAPPPPPVSPQATPLDLVTSAVGLNVAPQATVIPPPAPPIQPAPPGGARREARQRQAATAKSEEGGDATEEGVSRVGDQTQASGGDLAQAPFTRHDRTRPAPSFTTVVNHTQPSAWPRTALYAGALTGAAALLALTLGLARPRRRRRLPERPSPAWSRVPPRRG